MTGFWGIFTASVWRRVLSGFAFIILLTTVFILGSYLQLSRIQSFSNDIAPIGSQLSSGQNFALGLSTLQTDFEKYTLTGGIQYRQRVEDSLNAMSDTLQSIRANELDASDLQLGRLEQAFAALQTRTLQLVQTDFFSLSANERNLTIVAFNDQIDEVSQAYEAVALETRQNLADISSKQRDTISILVVQFAIMGALSVIGSLVAAQWIYRSIARPVARTAQAAGRVAAGELTARVDMPPRRDEVGQLATAFNSMAAQLGDLVGSLEQRVSARTRDLFLTLEVGQLATRSYQEPDLLPRLTEYIRQQFGLYYTQIYLLDDVQRYAVLQAGTGEVGQQLLARGHRLDLRETSIVARTVQERAPVLVSDTQTSAVHKPNPLLPDTRSEVAVPLIVGDDILGVLDMQATQPGTFNEDNLPVFRAMAAQIAAAVRGAQSFQQAQAAVQRADLINARLTREQWASYLGRAAEGQRIGYAYDLQTVTEAPPETTPTVHPDGGNGHRLNRLIQLRGEPIGAIEVGGDDDRRWSEEELALIEGVAERVALAVEQFRSFDETQQRAAEMQTVAEVGAESSRTLDPERLLWDVSNLVKERFGLYHAHIYLLDESGEELVLAAGAGEAGRTMVAEGRRIALDSERSLVARAARSREAVIVNDVQHAPDFLPNPLLPETRSEMAIPMVVGEQVIGVLDVQSDRVDYFGEQDVQVQSTLAAQVAIAVQNARQFEETQRRVRDLQAVNRVTDIIRSAESLERMLEEIVDTVVETFGADTGAITRLDLDEQVWLGIAGGTSGLTTDIVKTFREQAEVYPNGLDAVKTQDVVATYDVSNYPNFPKAYIEALGLKSVIVIPIEFAADYASVMYVNYTSRFHEFTPDEVQLARSLADQISVGIASWRAQESVREQQALLRAIIDTTPDWIFAKDRNYRYLLVNQAFARDYGGLTPEEMVGKDDYELGTPVELIEGNPEKGIAGFRVDDRKVIESEQSIHNPYDVVNLTDGTQHVFDTNKLPLRDAQGQVIGVLGIARDVTERIQAERERREREQLLRAIIDSTPDWIFVKDRNFRFQLVNKGFADAQNMKPEDFIGKDDYDLGFPPHLIEGDPEHGIVGFRATDRQALSGEVATIPYDPVTFADGSFHILDTIKSPLRNAEGEVVALLGVGHDVTERQQLLEQLQQTSFNLAERLKELAALQDVGAYGEQNLALEEYLTRVANRIPTSMQFPELAVAAIEFGGEVYGDRRALEAAVSVTNPLVIAEQSAGRLVVGYTEERALVPEEIPHLRDIAGRVSTYLENRQLFEQTQQALEQTATLFNSSRALIMSNEPQALLQAMVGTTLKDSRCTAVLFYNEGVNPAQPDEMVVAAAVGSSDLIVPPPVGAHFKIDEMPFTQQIAQNPSDIMSVPDLEAADIGEELLAGFGASNIQASAFIPLTTRAGSWVGTVVLSWPEPHALDEQERQLYAVLAPQMATVIENQRLLEQSIRRAAEMQTVAEVGAEASSSLDPTRLLFNVSNLTKERFGLYHVHIYLLDEAGEFLELAAGAGTAGEIMVQAGHRIAFDNPRSLVARAARSRQVVIANDVTQEEDFLPNPLLPDTKSEMAVPMIAGDEVIGVLDVQSERVNRFTDEDVQIKSTLASQVAVAVQNARLYAEQVKVADQLREVDRLKSEFLASMSHELRTPLNSIIGYAEVLLDGIDGELTDDMNEDITAIHGSGRHLLNLINDILDLAKIEAGQMDLVREEVELEPFVHDVLQTSRVLLQSKRVELLVEMPADLPHVWADPLRLRQIVSNLISNAIKFTEQGSITVRAQVYQPDPDKVQISVIDTGIGISAQNLPLVFERFRQVDQSHTRRVGGTGLGLSITRQLVQMHGGDIWVESELGVGSTFTFTIPTSEAAHAEA